MQKKRGQITVFIILGIVFLMSAAVYTYVQERSSVFRTERIPGNVEPIRVYIEACGKLVGEQAVTKLGLQAGYMDIPADMKGELQLPYSSIPYWYYKGKNRIPTIESMQSDISEFAEKSLMDCIGSLEQFKEQYEITAIGPLSVESFIREEDVVLMTTYHIRAGPIGKGQVTDITKYKSVVNIRLGAVYELAKKIMQEENSENFLEDLTLEMIATANTDNGRFPFEGMEITCSDRARSISADLVPDLQKVLQHNLHFLKFANTKGVSNNGPDYFPEELAGMEEYYYAERQSPELLPQPPQSEYKINYLVDLGRPYKDIKVDTIFNDFMINMKVHPSSGDIVKPISFDMPVVGQCIKIYHHFYTVEYPVVFSLTDYKTPVPFVFNFATPVVIVNNKPKRDISLLYQDLEMRAITGEDYCTRKDYLMKVNALDSVTSDEIEDVNIRYQCVQYECDFGKTQRGYIGKVPVTSPNINAYFPACFGGLLIAEKEGYLAEQVQVTTVKGDRDAEGIVNIYMTPLRKLEYSFRVKELDSSGKLIKTRGLRENEVAYMSIYSKEKDYTATIVYPNELPDELNLYKNLELLNGNYEYELIVRLLKEENGEEIVIGGYELPDWSASSIELISANKIAFNILVPSAEPSDVKQMAEAWRDIVAPKSKEPLYRPAIS